jgi:hypothetical protein
VLGHGTSTFPILAIFLTSLVFKLSVTTDIISALTPNDFQLLSTTKTFLVFFTDFIIIFLSKGRIVLRSITSADILNFSFNIFRSF